jgi:hypothetical protein
MKTNTESPGAPEELGSTAGGPGKPATDQSNPKRAKFRLQKVLMIVVPVIALAIGALVLVRVVNVDTLLSDLSRPRLVPASGTVLFHGQPLRNGQIATYPDSRRGLPAIGWTDDEGKFTLKTDIRGNLVEGATVGDHRVVVTSYQTIAAAAAPPLLTPQLYASLGSSPLRITVGSAAAENQFELVLEGDAPERPQWQKSGGGKGKGSAQKKAKPAPSEENTPAPPEENTTAPSEEK